MVLHPSGSVDGVLVVDKPVGPSSHEVVTCARRSLRIRRIGHTGTLDPRASGVLPLVLGQATRLAHYLTQSDKEYEATIRFGIVTDTYDAAGTVIDRSGLVPALAEIECALQHFRGSFAQIPPLYSAKMVGGKRSYVRARSGKPVQPPAVSVTAHALELLDVEGERATLRVRCAAGFYVRALAHDLGQRLGVGAILDGLVRTEAAGFRLIDALPFATLVTASPTDLRSMVRPIESLLAGLPEASLTSEGVQWARHGRDIGPAQMAAPLAAFPDLFRMVGPDGRLVGLAARSVTPGFLHPTAVFSYN